MDFIIKFYSQAPIALIILVINILCIIGSLIALSIIQKSEESVKDKKFFTIIDLVFLFINLILLVLILAISFYLGLIFLLIG